jgi:hypothetical protein
MVVGEGSRAVADLSLASPGSSGGGGASAPTLREALGLTFEADLKVFHEERVAAADGPFAWSLPGGVVLELYERSEAKYVNAQPIIPTQICTLFTDVCSGTLPDRAFAQRKGHHYDLTSSSRVEHHPLGLIIILSG